MSGVQSSPAEPDPFFSRLSDWSNLSLRMRNGPASTPAEHRQSSHVPAIQPAPKQQCELKTVQSVRRPLSMLRALGLAGKQTSHVLRAAAPVPAPAVAAAFSTSTTHAKKAMPPRPKPPPEEDIEECFIHGSGPGGQKINKTASAVQLKHIPTGLVVKSQATRSREQNRKIARELLAAKLDVMANGEQSRTIIVGNYKKKRADSAAKKARRKYRKLEEEKGGAKEGDGEEGQGKRIVGDEAGAGQDAGATAEEAPKTDVSQQ
ncbi:RF-1 domain-containing protein [Coniochaeta sp. 2T2.1]|nr:RF-1 domain-containing protein [Coniochaeta sp. 2T2.1]